MLQELPGGVSVCLFNELGCGELTRAVDADKEIELSLCRLDFSDINMEEADGVALELLALRLVPLDFRQARDAMPLQAAMQSRPRQMWDRGLQSIEAVIQWQQRVVPKRDDCRLLCLSQNR